MEYQRWQTVVPLKDLLYVNQTMGEMIRFFHQREHYPTLERIEQFLGNAESDEAFAALRRCYYDVMRDVWPDDIAAKFDDGDFDNSASPFYHRPVDDPDA